MFFLPNAITLCSEGQLVSRTQVIAILGVVALLSMPTSMSEDGDKSMVFGSELDNLNTAKKDVREKLESYSDTIRIVQIAAIVIGVVSPLTLLIGLLTVGVPFKNELFMAALIPVWYMPGTVAG